MHNQQLRGGGLSLLQKERCFHATGPPSGHVVLGSHQLDFHLKLSVSRPWKHLLSSRELSSQINVWTSWTWHFSHTLSLCYDTNSHAGAMQGRTPSRLPLEHRFAVRLVPFSCHHGYVIQTAMNHSWTTLHDLFLHSTVKAFHTSAGV